MPAQTSVFVVPNIFDQLRAKNDELNVTVTQFRMACAELAAKNGNGEPVRRRIRTALLQIRGNQRGSSR